MTELRFIAGSGRSGTTWVLDALADANGLRPVFEPLNPVVSNIGFNYAHRFLAPDASHPDLRAFFEDVIAGRRDRLWTQYRREGPRLLSFSSGPDIFTGGQNLVFRWLKFLKEAPHLARMTMRPNPLVKCIRANLMLGWIARQFDCRIVLLLRHPGAVIDSEMRNAWDPAPALDRFRSDAGLHQLSGGRYRGLLGRKLTHAQGLAAQWLIENQLAIEMAPAANVAVFFYERLRTASDRSWEQLRVALDLERAPDATVLAKPSQQTSPNRLAAQSPGASSVTWQETMSRDQISEIQAVLDESEFDLYSMNDCQPHGSVANPVIAATSESQR